ncbi:CcdB family protein [Skermanella sp. TT6]|uniref:Toxin CcdB n=1 Tax=Skermanella cutis TaxID=2775420 RepID=A0ABX7BIF5_9PROT|nr:CcdB family protein [Skermanella sp. TT6]
MLKVSGYLIDIQANVSDSLNTRVIIPLMERQQAPKPAKRLNPVFVIGDLEVVMVTQYITAVPISALKSPVATLGYRALPTG